MTAIRSHITLALSTALHAFTHAYGIMLVPLYLMMVDDLGLRGVRAASLIVTIYGLVYCLGSFPAGILADRFNRKALLGIGLIGNALAILLMGLTRRYEMLVALSVMAGLFGTLFHPAANAMVPAHYPHAPGMAIGLLGIGSGIGFFAGPQFAGWRAQAARWQWGAIGDWQRPLVEAGLLGIVFGILFLIVAREAKRHDATRTIHRHRPLPGGMRRRVLSIAAVMCCRDFAGVATFTLLSIYLQKALGYAPKRTGLLIGAMMLMGVVANPVAVWLSGGRRRLRALGGILICGGLVLATVPWAAAAWLLPVLMCFQMLHLGSYAVGEAALLERVGPNDRGRVIGLFIGLAGTIASSAAWAMGRWTDSLGSAAEVRQSYILPFAALGGLMMVAALAMPLIARLGPASEPEPQAPAREIDPGTMSAAG